MLNSITIPEINHIKKAYTMSELLGRCPRFVDDVPSTMILIYANNMSLINDLINEMYKEVSGYANQHVKDDLNRTCWLPLKYNPLVLTSSLISDIGIDNLTVHIDKILMIILFSIGYDSIVCTYSDVILTFHNLGVFLSTLDNFQMNVAFEYLWDSFNSGTSTRISMLGSWIENIVEFIELTDSVKFMFHAEATLLRDIISYNYRINCKICNPHHPAFNVLYGPLMKQENMSRIIYDTLTEFLA